MLALCFVFAMFYVNGVRDGDSGPVVVSEAWSMPRSPVTGAPQRGPTTPGSGNAFDQFLNGVHQNVRTTVQKQRRTALREVDEDMFGLPRDFALYKAQLRELAKAPQWSKGMAQRLERLGRIGFVAGVVMLHDLDHDDADDLAQVVNLQRFLGEASGIEGLAHQLSGNDPDASDACRSLAMTDAWRRVAERFARTEIAWSQLLASRGKVVGSQK